METASSGYSSEDSVMLFGKLRYVFPQLTGFVYIRNGGWPATAFSEGCYLFRGTKRTTTLGVPYAGGDITLVSFPVKVRVLVT